MTLIDIYIYMPNFQFNWCSQMFLWGDWFCFIFLFFFFGHIYKFWIYISMINMFSTFVAFTDMIVSYWRVYVLYCRISGDRGQFDGGKHYEMNYNFILLISVLTQTPTADFSLYILTIEKCGISKNNDLINSGGCWCCTLEMRFNSDLNLVNVRWLIY